MSGTENSPTGTLQERLRLGAGFAEARRDLIRQIEDERSRREPRERRKTRKRTT
jgi:hypothetical protein